MRPPVREMLLSAWRCRCPRCHQGALFAGWPNKVLPQCGQCGLSYHREPGYYVGGMVVTYILSVAVLAVVSLVVFFLLPDTGFFSENEKMAIWFAAAILVTLGFLRRSYSLWISLDYWIEPWEPGEHG